MSLYIKVKVTWCQCPFPIREMLKTVLNMVLMITTLCMHQVLPLNDAAASSSMCIHMLMYTSKFNTAQLSRLKGSSMKSMKIILRNLVLYNSYLHYDCSSNEYQVIVSTDINTVLGHQSSQWHLLHSVVLNRWS